MLRNLERMMRQGQLPDPRTTQGLVVYFIIGFAIGWWLQVSF